MKNISTETQDLLPKKKEHVESLCSEGNLFVLKKEYQDLAEHLSKNLGSLLTEHYLDEASAAKIFHNGLSENVLSFYSNPVIENLEEIRKNLAIFCEYLWIDNQRASHFFNALDKCGTLYAHAVNTLFTGVSLYITIHGEKSNIVKMNSFAMGLILHDIGMTQIPSTLKDKKGSLVYKEKIRIQEHVDIADKMLNRLSVTDEVILNSVMDHHERLNGSGYPKGKKADRLSMEARICAVADVFCAMISPRPYRNSINPILASIVLTKCGEKFDQKVVSALLKFIISQNSEMKQILDDKQKLAQLSAMATNMCKQ